MMAPRNIVVAANSNELGEQAVQYAVLEVVRPGDTLHIVHVAPVLQPQTIITHVAPQTTYDVPEDLDRQQMLQKVQAYVKAKFQVHAELCEVPCFPHIYLDTDNVTAADVAAVISKLCEELPADLLVVGFKEKDVWTKLSYGSVVQQIMNSSKVPLLMVKQYAPGSYDKLLAGEPAEAEAAAAAEAAWLAGS